MKELISYLQSIQNKTGLIAKLLGVLICANLILPAYVSVSALDWIDLVAVIAVSWMKFFAPSGQLPKGWTFWFYVINGCLFATEAFNIFSAAHPIDTLLMVKITAVINGIYSLAQWFNGMQAKSV